MFSVAFPFVVSRAPLTTEIHTRGESIGLVFDALAGLASAVSAMLVLVLIFRRIYKDGWTSWEALHVSVISLFVAEVIMGVGHAMNVQWIIEGRSYTSTFCTAQGLMRQLGGTYAALSTLVIAVQTFLTIWQLRHLNRTISVIVNSTTFCFMVLWVGIGFGIHTHPKKEFYATPTPYWCWIGKAFKGERLGGEYVWFWTTLFVSIISYIPLFLLHRGVIAPGTRWYQPKADVTSTRSSLATDSTGAKEGSSSESRNSGCHQDVSTVSGNLEVVPHRDRKLWSTILYPVVYCVLTLPLTVVRWITFGHKAPPDPSHRWKPIATFAVVFVFALSGVFNALLYFLTRTRFFQSDRRREPPAPTLKMPQTTATGQEE